MSSRITHIVYMVIAVMFGVYIYGKIQERE